MAQGRIGMGRWWQGTGLGLVLALVLALPAGQAVFGWLPEPKLGGHAGAPLQPLTFSAEAWFSGRWQVLAAKTIEQEIGGRAWAVRSYNEMRSHLIPSRPIPAYAWGAEVGFVPVDTMRRLDYDIANRSRVGRLYPLAGRQLRLSQQVLQRRGVFALNVIAPPKVRVDSRAILPGYSHAAYWRAGDPYALAPSFGSAAAAATARVLDFEARLRADASTRWYPSHGAAGFHWTYFTGCMVTRTILQVYREAGHPEAPGLNCDDYMYGPTRSADGDVIPFLNLLWPERFASNNFYASPRLEPHDRRLPRITIVGDSYSDQLLYALQQVLPQDQEIIKLDYFMKHDVHGPNNRKSSVPIDRTALDWNRLLDTDILLVVTSDGNLRRDNPAAIDFDFHSALLKAELPILAGPEAMTPALAARQATLPSSDPLEREFGFFSAPPPQSGRPLQLIVDFATPSRGASFEMNGERLDAAEVAPERFQITVPSRLLPASGLLAHRLVIRATDEKPLPTLAGLAAVF
jgi:hypothetical protein